MRRGARRRRSASSLVAVVVNESGITAECQLAVNLGAITSREALTLTPGLVML